MQQNPFKVYGGVETGRRDVRKVVADTHKTYFGAEINRQEFAENEASHCNPEGSRQAHPTHSSTRSNGLSQKKWTQRISNEELVWNKQFHSLEERFHENARRCVVNQLAPFPLKRSSQSKGATGRTRAHRVWRARHRLRITPE
jgi:hypothetical protein